MAKAPAILGVHLLDAKLGPVKIGTLTRDNTLTLVQEVRGSAKT